MLKLFLIILLSKFVFALNQNDYETYVVFPKSKAGGTFYLSTETYKKKGYISILNPINIKKRNGKLVFKKITELKTGIRYKYYEFITAYGAHGYIKSNMIKPLSELSQKNDLDVIDEQYNQIVAPINPYLEINVFLLLNNHHLKLKEFVWSLVS